MDMPNHLYLNNAIDYHKEKRHNHTMYHRAAAERFDKANRRGESSADDWASLAHHYERKSNYHQALVDALKEYKRTGNCDALVSKLIDNPKYTSRAPYLHRHFRQ